MTTRQQIILIGVFSSIFLLSAVSFAGALDSFWITGHSKFNEGAKLAAERMENAARTACQVKNLRTAIQVSQTQCYGYLSRFSCQAQFQCSLSAQMFVLNKMTQSCVGLPDGASCGSEFLTCFHERCVFHWD